MHRCALLASLASLALSALACGNSVQTQTGGTTSGAGGGNGGASASSSSASTTNGSLVTSSSSSGTTSAATTSSGGPVDAGPRGPFECMSLGCICDGATHYCTISYAGKAPGPPGPPPLPVCDEADAGAWSGCIPLPPSCAAAPTCATCFPDMNGPCSCEDHGAGLQIICALP